MMKKRKKIEKNYNIEKEEILFIWVEFWEMRKKNSSACDLFQFNIKF